MMCERCDQPMTDEESKAYIIPGASGPGLTIRVHKDPCPSPHRPRTYTY